MRMRKRRGGGSAEVMLAPMIDCVFLLLIFFLVTSMIKRFERQIPVALADPTAAIDGDQKKDVFEVAIDAQGQLYAESGLGREGSMTFRRVDNAETFLAKLATERGTDRPLQVSIDGDAEFQQVIRVQDQLEMNEFRNIMFRSSDRPVEERKR